MRIKITNPTDTGRITLSLPLGSQFSSCSCNGITVPVTPLLHTSHHLSYSLCTPIPTTGSSIAVYSYTTVLGSMREPMNESHTAHSPVVTSPVPRGAGLRRPITATARPTRRRPGLAPGATWLQRGPRHRTPNTYEYCS